MTMLLGPAKKKEAPAGKPAADGAEAAPAVDVAEVIQQAAVLEVLGAAVHPLGLCRRGLADRQRILEVRMRPRDDVY